MRRALLALLLAVAWPYALAAQRDTTVCTAFRTRTALSGAILSTSVAKVACGGAARVDTIAVTRIDTLRDTLRIPLPPAPAPVDPRGYNCWQVRDAIEIACIPDDQAPALSQTKVLRANGKTFGYARWMWKGVAYPTDPSLPTAGAARVDTVTITRRDTLRTTDTLTWVPKFTAGADSIRWALEKLLVAPAPIPFPRDKYFYWQPRADPDSIRWTMVLRNAGTPPGAVAYPARPTPTPVSSAPEGPRTFLNTKMPVQPLTGDTLYHVNGVLWCRGPTCDVTRVRRGLSALQPVPAPPVQFPLILVGKP